MKNFLLGFLLGLAVATSAGVLAQSTGSVFGDGDFKTFQDSQTGVTGSTLSGGGLTIYQDSTGRTASYFSPTPLLGTYDLSTPCVK